MQKTPKQYTLNTPEGTIEYTLTRKRVRNLNLRVQAGGKVVASAPLRMPMKDIEAFLCQRAAWIKQHSTRLASQPQPMPCRYTKEQCLAIFTAISDNVFPLFEGVLAGQKPVIKVREMKSRWGVCHPQKHSITLNTRLAEKPRAALEYVVLHEYVHFLHPNHQDGFHAEMARLMPDYKQRRKLLRGAE